MGGLISLHFLLSPKKERPCSLEHSAVMSSVPRTPPCGRRRSRPASGTPSSSTSSWTDSSTSSTDFSDTSSITSVGDITETGGSLASSPSSSSTSLALSPASSLSTSSTSLSSGQLSARPPPHKRPRGSWFPGRRRRNPGRSVSEQGEDPSDGDETENSEANARTASQLESRLREMEHALKCAICFSRRRDVAFLCGHAACSSCAAEIRSCHICRRPIKKRIRLY